MKRMKMMSIFFFLVFLSIIEIGCGKNVSQPVIFSDSYVFGQDSQYSYINRCFGLGGVSESPDGYFFLSGPRNSFLYYFDRASGQTSPVCNKPDCLHVNEPDNKKIANCNACLGLRITCLSYYQDAIYFVTEEESQNSGYSVLYTKSIDGTKSRRLAKFTDPIRDLQIHRGYIYFAAQDSGTIAGKESSTKTTFKLCRIPLSKPGSKPEVIDSGKQIYGQIDNILCYGNYIYYSAYYYDDEKLESSTNYINRVDIRTIESQRVLTGGSPCFTVFNGKLIYLILNQGTFICDLDGKNSLKITDDYGYYCANNSFLLIDNCIEAAFNKANRILTIVDKNWQVVRTVPLTILNGMTDVPLGCSNEYYFINVGGRNNDIDEIITLDYIPIDKLYDDMSPRTFCEYIPIVPFNGISSRN